MADAGGVPAPVVQPGASGTGDPTADGAIAKMDAAFDKAINVNAAITEHKTIKGAIETAAQQRPNIG